jgi:hypothetical protein
MPANFHVLERPAPTCAIAPLRCSRLTVKDFERGDRKPMVNNLEAMRRAIEAAGVVLIEEDGRSIGIRAG